MKESIINIQTNMIKIMIDMTEEKEKTPHIKIIIMKIQTIIIIQITILLNMIKKENLKKKDIEIEIEGIMKEIEIEILGKDLIQKVLKLSRK
jgi:hypothetical protein